MSKPVLNINADAENIPLGLGIPEERSNELIKAARHAVNVGKDVLESMQIAFRAAENNEEVVYLTWVMSKIISQREITPLSKLLGL